MCGEVGVEVGALPFEIRGLLVWVAKLAWKLGRCPLRLGVAGVSGEVGVQVGELPREIGGVLV